MKQASCFLVLCILTLFTASDLFAQTARSFTYQGIILTATKQPLSGEHRLTVKLYDSPTDGTAVHTEEFSTNIENGVFNVTIGSETPLASSVTFAKQYWLGVRVDDGGELAPRTALTSVPNALTATQAASLSPTATGAVRSINGSAGDITVKGGNGLDINTVGNTITISNSPTNYKGGGAPQQSFVNQISGTTNQVLVNGGTLAATGNVSLTLPQDIATISSPSFSGLTLTGLNSAGVVHNNASGSLSTSLITNADVSSSAAIADSKLATITSAGKVGNSATTASSTNNANAIVARDASGNFSAGTITGNLIGNVTGNATTSSTFTGSLSGDVTGTESATVVSTVGGQTAANVASGSLAANAATNSNTASTIVKRDASGNFSAGSITANLIGNVTGNATTASTFTGTLTGDVTGTENATVVGTVGGQSAANVASGVTAANAATNINTANTIVKRDGSGNFSAGQMTGNLSGNVIGNLVGNVTGNLTGNIVGNLTGNVTGDISGTSSNVTGVVTEVHGGTNQNSYAAGDILYATGVNTLGKRAIGATGNVLSVSGGVPVWSSLSTLGVTSVAGTTNQVLVNGGTSPQLGAVVLSLPQNINTAATPQFVNLNLSAIPTSSTYTNIVVSNGGALQTRSVASLSDTYWSRHGNGSTAPGTDYVGTSDANALYLGVNGAPSVILNTNASIQRDPAGNARGLGAIDLQNDRTSPTQVASGSRTFIGGGSQNAANADYSAVAGGFLNATTGQYASIGGGSDNTASNFFSSVSGGQSNQCDGYSGTIGGGYNNHTLSNYPTIGGGQLNYAYADYSFIGGGYFNVAQASYVTIGGGYNNQSNNIYGTVSGGLQNFVYSNAGAIGGGSGNASVGDYSSIAGGLSNTTNANYSSIPGGANNVTTSGADYSVAIGNAANTAQYGQQAQASGSFATVGDAQTSVYVERGVTNSTTAVNLTLNGGTTQLVVPGSTTFAFRILVAARDDNGNSATYIIEGNAANNAGTVTVTSSATISYSNGFTTGMVAIGSTGANLNIKVSDSDGTHTVRWVARVQTSEVTF